MVSISYFGGNRGKLLLGFCSFISCTIYHKLCTRQVPHVHFVHITSSSPAWRPPNEVSGDLARFLSERSASGSAGIVPKATSGAADCSALFFLIKNFNSVCLFFVSYFFLLFFHSPVLFFTDDALFPTFFLFSPHYFIPGIVLSHFFPIESLLRYS